VKHGLEFQLVAGESVLEHPGARLVALRLAEGARVVPRPHFRRVAGDLRRLGRVDALRPRRRRPPRRAA
jgi:hypothetical protein